MSARLPSSVPGVAAPAGHSSLREAAVAALSAVIDDLKEQAAALMPRTPASEDKNAADFCSREFVSNVTSLTRNEA
jgi:hypothetical protein